MSKPLSVSANAGTSGSCGERLAVVTASALKRPACTCGMAGGVVENVSATSPPSSALTAGALPLYGTCTIFVPAIDENVSPERCTIVPFPEDAYAISPGRDLANAMNSLTERAGSDGCTTMTSGVCATMAICEKSRTESYGSL